MKYLALAALLILLLLLLYSRVRPYIQTIKKLIATLQGAPTGAGNKRKSVDSESKLVRCVACGTWIPADRVISAMGSSAYCSRECLEKPPKEHKAVS